MPTATEHAAPAGMARRPKPDRVLLKLSGEAFCKPGGFGIDTEELGVIASEVQDAASAARRIVSELLLNNAADSAARPPL